MDDSVSGMIIRHYAARLPESLDTPSIDASKDIVEITLAFFELPRTAVASEGIGRTLCSIGSIQLVYLSPALSKVSRRSMYLVHFQRKYETDGLPSVQTVTKSGGGCRFHRTRLYFLTSSYLQFDISTEDLPRLH